MVFQLVPWSKCTKMIWKLQECHDLVQLIPSLRFQHLMSQLKCQVFQSLCLSSTCAPQYPSPQTLLSLSYSWVPLRTYILYLGHYRVSLRFPFGQNGIIAKVSWKCGWHLQPSPPGSPLEHEWASPRWFEWKFLSLPLPALPPAPHVLNFPSPKAAWAKEQALEIHSQKCGVGGKYRIFQNEGLGDAKVVQREEYARRIEMNGQQAEPKVGLGRSKWHYPTTQGHPWRETCHRYRRDSHHRGLKRGTGRWVYKTCCLSQPGRRVPQTCLFLFLPSFWS